MEPYSTTDFRIQDLAEADRPREKLLLKGESSLSDAELIAILIGSGTTEMNAVDLSRLILRTVDNDLSMLAKLSVKELQKFKGIGEAKAINIVSALELGKRRKDTAPTKRTKIRSAKDAYDIFREDLLDLPYEEFWLLLLNRANEIIKKVRISQGGISGTVADSRIIFKHAIEHLASGMILAHNHPSGNREPSIADKQLTNKMVAAGKIMGISVLDHLIFTNTDYFSFLDEGLM